jgi:hypothetical protein
MRHPVFAIALVTAFGKIAGATAQVYPGLSGAPNRRNLERQPKAAASVAAANAERGEGGASVQDFGSP